MKKESKIIIEVIFLIIIYIVLILGYYNLSLCPMFGIQRSNLFCDSTNVFGIIFFLFLATLPVAIIITAIITIYLIFDIYRNLRKKK